MEIRKRKPILVNKSVKFGSLLLLICFTFSIYFFDIIKGQNVNMVLISLEGFTFGYTNKTDNFKL